jgi:hypothetical protein
MQRRRKVFSEILDTMSDEIRLVGGAERNNHVSEYDEVVGPPVIIPPRERYSVWHSLGPLPRNDYFTIHHHQLESQTSMLSAGRLFGHA